MKNLITPTEAKKLVAGSDQRKEVLIGQMNYAIEERASRGFTNAHFPTSANEIEKEWLKSQLVIAGFSFKDSMVTW